LRRTARLPRTLGPLTLQAICHRDRQSGKTRADLSLTQNCKVYIGRR